MDVDNLQAPKDQKNPDGSFGKNTVVCAIGLSCGINALFSVALSIPLVLSPVQAQLVVTLSIVFACVLFGIVMWFSEHLQGQAASRVLYCIAVAAVIACYATLFLGAAQAFPAALSMVFACGCVGTLTAWEKELSRFANQPVTLMSCAAFLFAGIMALVSNILPLWGICALALVCVVISGVAIVLGASDIPEGIPVVSNELSSERHKTMSGNGFTLFMDGVMIGAMVIAFHVDMDSHIVCSVFGITLFASAVFSLLMMSDQLMRFKVVDFLKKSHSLVLVLCLVGQFSTMATVKLVFLAVLLFWCAMNLSFVISAIAEVARFSMIAPVWLACREFITVTAGAALSALILGLTSLLPQQFVSAVAFSSDALAIFVILAVGCTLQLSVNKQVYPLMVTDDYSTSANESQTVRDEAEANAPGSGKATWSARCKKVAIHYNLTERQEEVMALLAKGRDTKYIMDVFQISQGTAKTHVYNIYKKLDVHSRQDLIDLVENIDDIAR